LPYDAGYGQLVALGVGEEFFPAVDRVGQVLRVNGALLFLTLGDESSSNGVVGFFEHFAVGER
jgi:hypothetical protein